MRDSAQDGAEVFLLISAFQLEIGQGSGHLEFFGEENRGFHFAGFLLENGARFGRRLANDDGNASLDDSSLFCGDFGEC